MAESTINAGIECDACGKVCGLPLAGNFCQLESEVVLCAECMAMLATMPFNLRGRIETFLLGNII